MRVLYHLWLSPPCRKVRIVLSEKGIEAEFKTENLWDRRPEFLALNPAGDVPVLVEENGQAICGSIAICEYLEEVAPLPSLLGASPLERAEVRRLVSWFDQKFNEEVSENLVGEKIMKRFLRRGAPDGAAIRAGKKNLGYHLEYIAWLCERRNWLAGNDMSLADIAAAAHLSCLDYLDDVPWGENERAKEWYVRMKSRPSMRPILADHLPGEPPPKHYADLDF
ncbi:MAG: glutathione S-transferase [Rhodospirillales bacterium]|nr:glutathione S-transferase [Rhodospirillales bacterium]|tara:strand:- start:1327 stop:1995 length:669 start_codon:yes stop_codon:yes gene_type:complete